MKNKFAVFQVEEEQEEGEVIGSIEEGINEVVEITIDS